MATVRKSVDRQATFDTDPSRARLSRGGLKLPVIEGKEKPNDKAGPTVSDNKTVKSVPKDLKNESNDSKSVLNKSKVNKSVEDLSRPHNKNDKGKKKENNTSGRNDSSADAKTLESNKKSNALSSVNKKVTAPASSNNTQTKEQGKKSPDKPANKSDTTNSDGQAKNKPKANDSKPSGESDKNVGIKSSASQKPLTGTNKEPYAVESAKVSKPVHGVSNKQKTSKGPEKQTSKSIDLKDSNDRGSVSPTKGKGTVHSKNLSPSEPTKTGHSTNSKETIKPRPKETSINKSVYLSQNTGTNAKNNLNKSKTSQESNKKDTQSDTHNDRDDSKTVTSKPQPHVKINSPAKHSGTVTPNNDKKSKQVEREKIATSSPVNSLPLNSAPSETHLPKQEKEDKNNSLNSSDKRVKSTSPKDATHELLITVQEERTEDFNLHDSSRPTTERTNISENVDENLTSPIQGQEPNSKRTLYTNNLRFPPSSNNDFDTTIDKLENDLKVDSQSKRETYVVSPSVSKVVKKPSTHSSYSNVGRLSPSNETVEHLKVEQRSEKPDMELDRKESYAQVYAERNTLLKAEITYRKRIKQLEEEANGFLKAIDELTTENRYLRSRVDALEDQSRGQGDLDSIDRISDLERDKAELENKVKRLEKASNDNTSSEETRELKEMIVKLQSDNQKLNQDNSKLKSEKDELSKKVDVLSSERKAYSKREESAEPENKQSTKQVSDLNAKVKRLEKKVNSLEFENKTLSETLTQKQSELGELLGVMKDENKFDTEIKELKNKVIKLTKDKKDTEQSFNKEKRALNETLQEIKMQLETKTKENDERKIKIDEKEKETKKLQSKAETTKKLVDSQKDEIERLKEENKRLMEEKDEYKEKYTIIVTESESAAHDISDAKDKLEQFNKDLQQIVSDKESQISKLINQLDTMREEKETQRKAASEERDKLLSEREKNSDHLKNIRRLETDLKHFVEKLDEAKTKEKTITNDLEDRSYEVSNLEKQVFELNMKMDNHSKRMNELDRDKREMEREKREWDVKKDKLNDIEASNRRLMDENKRLRNQIEMGNASSQPDYRMPEPPHENKPVVEAWVNINSTHSHTQAVYVQKDKQQRERARKVQLVQPSIQKKRQPYSKSSPLKQKPKAYEHKSADASTHRSMEDLRKVSDAARTPESEHSLPELSHDARMTYAGFGGYREIHKNRIRAAQKRIY